MPYTPRLPLIASLSKRAYLLDHCQGLRPLRKVALIVLGVNWTSMKKAAKMHTVICQHLIKQAIPASENIPLGNNSTNM